MLEAGFVDGALATGETLDLVGSDIYADNINTKFCETCSGNKPNIPRADNGNVHSLLPKLYLITDKTYGSRAQMRVTRKVIVQCARLRAFSRRDCGYLVG